MSSGTTTTSSSGNWYVMSSNGSGGTIDFEIYVDEMYEIRRRVGEKHEEVIKKASKQFRP